jgi:hypothetical protein
LNNTRKIETAGSLITAALKNPGKRKHLPGSGLKLEAGRYWKQEKGNVKLIALRAGQKLLFSTQTE